MFTRLRLNIPWFSRNLYTMDELVEEVNELCFNFNDNIRNNNSTSSDKLRKICYSHLEAVSAISKSEIKLPDFTPGLEWVNVTEPLSLRNHLQGKIVILDFFTYCCINCMHILPDLKRLEKEITVEDGLVVLGVHSAKFTNERKTSNIEAAIRRYDITHPVVNDNVEAMWRALQVNCWPTLYVLGPSGEPILMLQGEGHYKTLRVFVSEAIAFYKKKGLIMKSSIPQIKAYSFPKNVNILSYPGKITVSKDGKQVAIADTAHNRIIITNTNGKILHEIGDHTPGLTDGNFENARFFSPQGLAYFDSDILFVSDTENHCIRKINLKKKEVSTVVGIGSQGHDYNGGKEGAKQALSSPWDLCFVNDILFIAMAGTHQIWAYFFKDSTLWKKSYKAGTCAAVVGSGREENKNNTYPLSAGLAQPSGISYDGKNHLFFADSESSTVRTVNMESGSVTGLVGGALDPRNLFAFGDKDGKGIDVKLQHPLGVAWSSYDNVLYVADTYNHKIKRIDTSTKHCSVIGNTDLQKFNEPGGLYVFENKMYIADTNNHSIKILNVSDHKITDFKLEYEKKTDLKSGEVFHNSSVTINPSESNFDLEINLSLPMNCSLTKEAPSKWIINIPGDRTLTYDENFSLTPKWNLNIDHETQNETSLTINAIGRLFLCIDDKCTVKELPFVISILFDTSAPKNVKHVINCSL